MDAGLLLRNFETIAESPGGVQRLRDLVLQLAVVGKLVEWDGKGLPGHALVDQMCREREELVRSGEVRRRTLRSPIGQAIPALVPECWAWSRLSDVTRDWGQKVPDRPFTYIDVGSIDNRVGRLGLDATVVQPTEAPSRARKMVRRETVIYSTVRPYLLNVAIIDRDLEPEPIASTAFSVLHPLSGLSPRFLHYYLRSRIFTKFVEGQMVGMAYPAIRDERLLQGPLPIPPLSEQESIVAKVDELMALCDELEKTQEHRRSVRKAVQVSALDALTSAETPEELERAWERARRNWFAIVGSADSVPPLRDAILQLAAAGNLMPRDPRDPWTVTTLGALGEFRGGGTLGEHLKTGHTSTSENRP